mgnify:CR=1 FL=1
MIRPVALALTLALVGHRSAAAPDRKSVAQA